MYEQQTAWPNVVEHAELVVLWGVNAQVTLKNSWNMPDHEGQAGFKALKEKGTRVISIDPVYNETAKLVGAEWIAPNAYTCLLYTSAQGIDPLQQVLVGGIDDREAVHRRHRCLCLQPPLVIEGHGHRQPIAPVSYTHLCKTHQLGLSFQGSLVYGNTGTHGGGDADFLDEYTLGGGRLGLLQGNQQRFQVFFQLNFVERDLAQSGMNDTVLVVTVTNLTSLGVLDGFGYVRSDGTHFRVRHQTARAQDLTQLLSLIHILICIYVD